VILRPSTDHHHIGPIMPPSNADLTKARNDIDEKKKYIQGLAEDDPTKPTEQEIYKEMIDLYNQDLVSAQKIPVSSMCLTLKTGSWLIFAQNAPR
jgi:hypothetical protein